MDEKNFKIYYLTGLIITAIFMLWILIGGILSLYITFLIFFWTIKFLSGFGLILSISNAFLFIMDKSKEKIDERGVKVLLILQIVIPIILIIYAIYRIFASLTPGSSGLTMAGVWADIFVWVDNIVYIYGIASLLLQLYIIPLIKGEFDEAINMGRNQKFGMGMRNFGRSVKKKWFSKKGDVAKAQLQDQKKLKELLAISRNKFAILLLIPLAIGSLVFTPIAFILIVFWLKIIIFDRTEIHKFEMIALLLSILTIMIIAILAPFVELGLLAQISRYLWTINIFYLIGIIIATLIFTVKFLSLQGVSIAEMRKEKTEKKVKDLKAEKKDLQKELKETKKSQ